MILRLLAKLYRGTLGSVLFGIVLMVLLAMYIAVGSGLAGVREYFEMNEHQFFTAWPLVVLSLLLVMSLSAVTIERIPFTPPRYGVWMIHSGIVVLIFGMMLYFKYKTEGLAFIPVGGTVSRYYDVQERALYARLNGITLRQHRLPSLPRFKPTSAELGNADRMNRDDLRNIVPLVQMPDSATGEFVEAPAAKFFNLPNDLEIDLIAYHPYATIKSRIIEAPGTDEPVIELILQDPHEPDLITHHLHAADPRRRWVPVPDSGIIEHRHVPDDHVDTMIAAAGQSPHRLSISVKGVSQSMEVRLGETYTIGETGYELTIEDFDPAWRTIDGQVVPLLTMMVQSPTMQFRRQVIPGRDNPTDWKLDVPGSGPMGQRQTVPLDADLLTSYTLHDPHGMVRQHNGDRYILLTSPTRFVLLALPKRGLPTYQRIDGNEVGFAMGDGHGHDYKVTARRVDNAGLADLVEPVPTHLRRSDQAGIFQVVTARVRMGDWSQEVAIPFQEWIFESRWMGGQVRLPHTGDVLQLQLGNTTLQMPVHVTLDKFELVNYMGGTPQSTNLFRDFKSYITITDRQTGKRREAVAHMNNPVYFGGLGDSEWTLFQARFDRENQNFTVLGVGNRPGVWVMTAGCVLMTIGLLWAFYLKPVIIRRMKQRALAEAAARRPQKATPPPAPAAMS